MEARLSRSVHRGVWIEAVRFVDNHRVNVRIFSWGKIFVVYYIDITR